MSLPSKDVRFQPGIQDISLRAECDREHDLYRVVDGRSKGREHTQCLSEVEDHDGAWTTNVQEGFVRVC